ncbi:MAG: arginine N-succinyltransferase [Chlamydiales bacterium]|nr:arginine N-succinyltransferase [Chlamydiales bacterium]
MIIIRPIQKDDFEQYKRLAFESHINFYTLPKNEIKLKARFDNAIKSFSSSDIEPKEQFYLFVAEDTSTKMLLGVSALAATSGGSEPLFFFSKEQLHVESTNTHVVKDIPVLHAVSYPQGPSEVCSLFVDPASRGTKVGKLLSLSRFLFAARFPERFLPSFITELRGKIENGTSVFWEAVGHHFFDASFAEVQEMQNFGRTFIQEFLPHFPIYIDLLPEDARAVIGKVDDDTQGALSMLTRLGFQLTEEVDVIDAGPKLSANKNAILPIQKSVVVTIAIEPTLTDAKLYIVANDRLDFRATIAEVSWVSDSTIAIKAEVALALNLHVGDTARIFDHTSI